MRLIMNPVHNQDDANAIQQWIEHQADGTKTDQGKMRLVSNTVDKRIEFLSEDVISKHPDNYQYLTIRDILNKTQELWNNPKTTGEMRNKIIKKVESLVSRRIEKFNSRFKFPVIDAFLNPEKPDFGEKDLKKLKGEDEIIRREAFHLKRDLTGHSTELLKNPKSQLGKFIDLPIEKWTKQMIGQGLFELASLELNSKKKDAKTIVAQFEKAAQFGNQPAKNILKTLKSGQILNNPPIKQSLTNQKNPANIPPAQQSPVQHAATSQPRQIKASVAKPEDASDPKAKIAKLSKLLKEQNL